jgi:hypothetical protein
MNSATIRIKTESAIEKAKPMSMRKGGIGRNRMHRIITMPNATGTMVLENAFNYNIPDNGNGGTAATYTLEPAGYSLATLSCGDANGCTLTMGETGVVAGASIVIIQIVAGSGNITLVDDDGTTAELDADANITFNALDSVTLHYAAVGNWIQTAYIDIS